MNIQPHQIISAADFVLDIVPGISTVYNGAILLYKVARKVDKAANPVVNGWKTDLKIHCLKKSAIESLVPMIPLFGNIAALIMHLYRSVYLRADPYISLFGTDTDDEVKELFLVRHGHGPDYEDTTIPRFLACAIAHKI